MCSRNFSVDGDGFSVTVDDDHHTPLDVLTICIEGLGLAVGILGTIGNILSAIILSRPKFRKTSINILLLGLSINDLVWVVGTIFFWGLPDLCRKIKTTYGNDYLDYVNPFTKQLAYPIGFTAQTGSIYFTVFITIERYVAVCHPLNTKSICRVRRAKIAAVFVTIFSIIYNFPRFFIWEIAYNDHIMLYQRQRTSLSADWIFSLFYMVWAYAILMFILPFLILFLLNVKVYRTMRRSNAARTLLTSSEKESNSLTFLLFAIVITFFVCNIFLPILMLLKRGFKAACIVEYIRPFASFGSTFNSSVNFIYYLVFAKRFRQEFVDLLKFKWLTSSHLFCYKPFKNEQSSMNSGRSNFISKEGIDTPLKKLGRTTSSTTFNIDSA